MAIRFQCPHCNSIRNVHERMSGKEFRCPDCESMVRIPTSEELAEDLISVVPIQIEAVATIPIESKRNDPFKIESKEVRAYPFDKSFELDNREDPSDDAFSDAISEFEVDDEEDEEPASFAFGKSVPKDDIDMTAMVDVTFLLLIFFMVTASFTSEKAIQQKAATSDRASSNAVPEQTEVNETVRILIDEFNAYTIIFPDGDEREASSKQELLGILAMAELEGSSDDASTMAVVAHEDSIHAAVIAALDAGREKGFSTFQVSVVEDFD